MPYFILPVDLLSFLMSASAVRNTDLVDAAFAARCQSQKLDSLERAGFVCEMKLIA